MVATSTHDMPEGMWRIRLAQEADQDHIWDLFQLSQADLKAVLADDPAEDVQDVAKWYLNAQESSRFWVAEDSSTGIIGIVGVKDLGDHVATVRRLHVHPDKRQRGIGSSLVEQALQFCHDSAFVKIMLEIERNQRAAIALFKRFGFRLSRSRKNGGREQYEFYIDLYQRPESAV